MTKEEINKYITDKKIPLSFIWEDNVEYYLICYTGFNSTTGNISALFEEWKYPNWDNDSKDPEITFVRFKDLFDSRRETFEECLSDFIYWFEINKERCIKIHYYHE